MTCRELTTDGLCKTSMRPPERCRVHNPRKRAFAPKPARQSGEDAAEARYLIKHACIHRGAAVASAGCASCSKTTTPTFTCELHGGTCTVLNRSTDAGVRWCGDCAEFEKQAPHISPEAPHIPPTVEGFAGWQIFSFADLTRTVHEWESTLPELSGVCGVPRSGMIPAAMIALRRNIPLVSIESLIAGTATHRNPRSRSIAQPDGPTLLVDDTCCSGSSMRRYRNILAGRDVLFGAVWAAPPGQHEVDTFAATVDDHYHTFEWNVGRDMHAQSTMFDMDGILCEEPPVIDWLPDRPNPEYEEWMPRARPLLRPSFPLHSICTGRLERYRDVTEAWLARHGITYGRLIMHPATDWRTREHEGHAAYKARHYAASDAILFLESSHAQAKAIHEMCGKSTVTLSPFEAFQ